MNAAKTYNLRASLISEVLRKGLATDRAPKAAKILPQNCVHLLLRGRNRKKDAEEMPESLTLFESKPLIISMSLADADANEKCCSFIIYEHSVLTKLGLL